MAIEFPALPYGLNDLEPYVSKETLQFHYGKHHEHYVTTLNHLIKNTPYNDMKLEEIILESVDKEGEDQKIFNNAAQSWNHSFLWNCMAKGSRNKPSSDFIGQIKNSFGTLEEFQEQFKTMAVEKFGSGWIWLVKDQDEKLSICSLSDAGNPLTKGQVPLLTCDVWEHAYYLDYKNEREKYVENFLQIVNWPFVETNFDKNKVYRSQKMRRGLEHTYQAPF